MRHKIPSSKLGVFNISRSRRSILSKCTLGARYSLRVTAGPWSHKGSSSTFLDIPNIHEKHAFRLMKWKSILPKRFIPEHSMKLVFIVGILWGRARGSNKLHEGFWRRNNVILNHGQVTWTTPELAPPLLTTTPHQREDVSALDRFNVHRCPTRRVFSGTGIELMTCLPWLDTLTTGLPQPSIDAQSTHVSFMEYFGVPAMVSSSSLDQDS
ncbi:uncharacterized protein TNCV_1616891 [Trichonephila clavipes]|nr:uncharacterized protein TNCV_1616891 [Trichonephila clavipes]